ncbi:pheST operon leader peptide PheM [Escherichia coli]|uniref:pheST attenuator peptide n=2 Tax=Enterobacterales TaxID=91347 RepID=A0A9D7AHW3_9GAMM|nr:MULTISPECIES: pheST operon leader peptide PheM [Enterobacterales]MDZ9511232.1 pheST operon leader peptide PheM [Escherichia coli]MBK5073120.1 pheST operon leader peptide PheM [Limnobaculum xujianqingii]MBK5176429.1 pheST operon leader peptide PheM [Limnobaculum xujianqingii]MBS0855016.1 pheST operon leader peptide PheM [Tatumella sp. JGM16]MBS0876047.1 pheST operon leader peptide PheM [Tatumella sp. JGM82]
MNSAIFRFFFYFST